MHIFRTKDQFKKLECDFRETLATSVLHRYFLKAIMVSVICVCSILASLLSNMSNFKKIVQKSSKYVVGINQKRPIMVILKTLDEFGMYSTLNHSTLIRLKLYRLLLMKSMLCFAKLSQNMTTDCLSHCIPFHTNLQYIWVNSYTIAEQ